MQEVNAGMNQGHFDGNSQILKICQRCRLGLSFNRNSIALNYVRGQTREARYMESLVVEIVTKLLAYLMKIARQHFSLNVPLM